MRRAAAVAALTLIAGLAFGQSLGEIAKREKKRRERNRSTEARVRTITESDLAAAPTPPPERDASTEPSDRMTLEGGDREAPSSRVPTGEPSREVAPSFELPDRTGRNVSLASLRGRPVLIDFWATWCAPCRQTMPEVERLHRTYGRRGLQVVGVNIEGRSEDVLSYLDEGRYSFRVLFDSGNWQAGVAQLYGVTSIPRTFLIDAEGRIVFSGHPARLPERSIEALVR